MKPELFLSLAEAKEKFGGRHDDSFFPVLTHLPANFLARPIVHYFENGCQFRADGQDALCTS